MIVILMMIDSCLMHFNLYDFAIISPQTGDQSHLTWKFFCIPAYSNCGELSWHFDTALLRVPALSLTFLFASDNSAAAETAILLRILCSFRFLCGISNICAKIFACPNKRRDNRKRLKRQRCCRYCCCCLQCVWLPLGLLWLPAFWPPTASSQPADESGRQSKDIIKQSSNKARKLKKKQHRFEIITKTC